MDDSVYYREEITLISDLPLEECHSRLRASVNRCSFFDLLPPTDSKPVIGFVMRTKFRIWRRKLPYLTNSPVLKGRLSAAEMGTVIRVEFAPQLQFPLMGCQFVFLVFMQVLIATRSSSEPMRIYPDFMPAAMAVVLIFFARSEFRKLKPARRFILDYVRYELEAKISETPDQLCAEKIAEGKSGPDASTGISSG